MPPDVADDAVGGEMNYYLPVIAFLEVSMLVGAVVFGLGAIRLIYALTHPAQRTVVPDVSSTRHTALTLTYYSGVLVSLVFGLRRNKFWALDGSVCLLAMASMAGLVASMMTFGGSWIGGVIGVLIVMFVGIFLRRLVKPVVRGRFLFVPRKGRPIPSLGLRIVAAYYILTAAIQFAEAYNPSPANILGTVPHGELLVIYAVATGSVCLSVGIGLYRMRRWAYRVALAYTFWSVVTLSYWMADRNGAAFHFISIQSQIVLGAVACASAGFTFWQLIVHRCDYS